MIDLKFWAMCTDAEIHEIKLICYNSNDWRVEKDEEEIAKFPTADDAIFWLNYNELTDVELDMEFGEEK